MLIMGTVRITSCKNELFPALMNSNNKNIQGANKEDNGKFGEGMILGCCITLVLFACFFTWFAYDFLLDFLKGVKINQTTVENIKDVWGAMYTKNENYNVYFGSKWKRMLPIELESGHNYLEQIYEYEDCNYKSMIHETNTIKNSSYYNDFYYDRYCFQKK